MIRSEAAGSLPEHRAGVCDGRLPAGFTLVEVMVAMAVVAVALPALLFALFQQIDGAEYLRQRTLANWVAANRLAELRLVVAKQGALPNGQLSGSSRMADKDWYWWVEQQATELPGFQRIEIRVGVEEGNEQATLHTLTAFMALETDNAIR